MNCIRKFVWALLAIVVAVGCGERNRSAAEQLVDDSEIMESLRAHSPGATVVEALGEKAVRDLYVDVYLEALTDDEIVVAAAFARSELGRKEARFGADIRSRMLSNEWPEGQAPPDKAALLDTLLDMNPAGRQLTDDMRNSIKFLFSETFSTEEIEALIAHNQRSETRALIDKFPEIFSKVSIRLSAAMRKQAESGN